MERNNENNNNQEIINVHINKRRKGYFLPTFIILLVLGVFGYYFLSNNPELLDGLLEKGEKITSEGEVALDKDFATGLRLASLERYDEAISYFEKVNFNKLSEADQELVLMTYLYSGNEQKALDLKEEIDEEIIRVLLENEDLEKLKELETDSKLIHFEIAVLDNDYEKIIELKDAERLEKDSRRANAIANAYYKLGQIEEAINYTALMASSGINMWELEGKTEANKNDFEMNNSVAEEKDIPAMKVGVFLFILFIISVGIYFVVINKENIKEELEIRREEKMRRKIEKLQEKSSRKKEVDKTTQNEQQDEPIKSRKSRKKRNEIKEETVKENNDEDKEVEETEDDKYSYHYED